MTDIDNIRALFFQAAHKATDTRGRPARMGKADGTLLYTDISGLTHQDRVWIRMGFEGPGQEVVAYNYRISPQPNLAVWVDTVNGRLTVIRVDEAQMAAMTGGRPGLDLPRHWSMLHRYGGIDPAVIDGRQILPLMAHPTSPASMAVTVEQGGYWHEDEYKIFETANSDSLSAYVPASGKHFVIICLDKANNAIEIVDGDDLTGGDALFGAGELTVADVLAITIPADYEPLAAVVLESSTTAVRAVNIAMDLQARLGGFVPAAAVETGEIMLSGAGGWPSTTNGATGPNLQNYASNGQDIYMMEFPAGAYKYAQWSIWMPDNWDGGDLTFKVAWTAGSGTAGDTITWGLQARAYAPDTAIDAAWGSIVQVSDALVAADYLHVSPVSIGMTAGGTVAAGYPLQFQGHRSSGGTLAVDAMLHSIKVYYGKAQ